MIKVIYSNGRYTPHVQCDICNSWIENAKYGAVVNSKGKSEGAHVDILYACKGKCLDIAELKLGGKIETGWEELEVHLAYVLHNSSVKPSDLQQIENTYGLL